MSPDFRNPVFTFFGGRKAFNGYMGCAIAVAMAFYMDATYTQMMVFVVASLGIPSAAMALKDCFGKE